MIKSNSIFLLLIGILLMYACKPKKPELVEGESVDAESLYYGQKPPGLVPEKLPDGTSDWIGGRYWVSTQVIQNLRPQG